MPCNNKLTIRRALEIQAGHLNHYGSRLTPKQEQELRRRVSLNTISPKVWEQDMDIPLDVISINQLVPRGGAIEAEVARVRQEMN